LTVTYNFCYSLALTVVQHHGKQVGREPLSVKNRITSLKDKHAAADAQLQLLQLLPFNNQEKIRELKKQKLKLKDEIKRLENPERLTAPKKQRHKKTESVRIETQEVPDTSAIQISAQPTSGIDLAA
jgi:hypothetical protein